MKNTNKQNKNKSKQNQRSEYLAIVPSRKYIMNPFPQTQHVTLKYLTSPLLNNTVGTAASRQFTANGLYDVDPAVGSTAISGFAEWMAIYNRYRVHATKATVDFINMDANPVTCNVGFEQQQFSANAKLLTYFENANQITRLSAGLGANPVRLQMKRNLNTLLGSVAQLADDDYAGDVTHNPILPIYVSIAISNYGLAFLTNGCIVRCKLEFEVEFYQLKMFAA